MIPPCAHRFVVDEQDWAERQTGVRCCLLCGLAYDREAFLFRLRRAIQERHRLPHRELWAEAGLEGP